MKSLMPGCQGAVHICAMIILVLAWSMSEISRELHTATSDRQPR
ncbi:MAG: hypothetical protein CM15mP103_06660 [Gammaproteobacteria bacterium]|nr:MAG: hypothetical protein CM15mP103_06660 [Gammaproteobacteria bacterium]